MIVWSNSPPIVKLTDPDYEQYAKAFISHLETWLIKGPGKNAPQAKAWNARISDAQNIADTYKHAGDKFAYLMDGLGGKVAAGLLIVQPQAPFLSVEYITTHPGSAGCGEILMECAVNYSQELHFGGKLALYAASQTARDFYSSIGFMVTDSSTSGPAHMKLEPATAPGSSKWTHGSGTHPWRLTRRMNESLFIIGMS